MNKPFLFFVCFVSAMGGLLFGYDWVVIGGAKIFYEQFFNITGNDLMVGLATSIALAGCMIGALTVGVLADKYGRKPLLIASASVFLISAVGTGAFSNIGLFLFARFISGIAIGSASGLSPMYIAEISPSSIRGKLVTINQLTIVIGILAAQIVNWRIAGVHDVQWNITCGWRWMFWSAAFPSFVFMILSFFIPESPRWYAVNGRVSAAAGIMKKIGGDVCTDEEISSIGEYGKNSHTGLADSFKLLFSTPFRKVLVLGCFIAFFQQWCGTNVIFNYAQEIFQNAGYDIDNTFINIVITGIANLLFTLVALACVEKLGRRFLMLLGASGLAVIYCALGSCYFFQLKGTFMVVLCVLAIACYAMTLGPVTWVLISEIFPNRVRAVAVASATFCLWIGSFSLTLSFPLLNSALGTSGTFWIYSTICAVAFVIFLKVLPETKGKTLEKIEEELNLV